MTRIRHGYRCFLHHKFRSKASWLTVNEIKDKATIREIESRFRNGVSMDFGDLGGEDVPCDLSRLNLFHRLDSTVEMFLFSCSMYFASDQAFTTEISVSGSRI